MRCTDREIATLLPWYITHTLSKEEEEKIRKHLAECPKCAKDLEEMRWLSAELEKYGKELFWEHIPSELLVIYSEAKDELHTEDLLRIEKHLESCQNCKRELQILEKVNQSLKPAREISLLEIIGQRLRGIFPKLLTKPALAYIIILLLLYPAWLGIFQLRREIRKMQEPRVAQANYELIQFDTRSGAKVENEIKIPPQTEVFSLSFSIPILAAENIRYDVEILDARNRRVWQKRDIKSLDEYGTFLLICHSRFFPEGSYTLKVEEVNTKDGQVQEEFVFSFELLKE